MSDVSILNKILNKQARVFVEEGLYGKSQVVLHEPKSVDHDAYSVVIHSIPKDAIVINADQFPSPSDIFNRSEGICKRADFIIITRSDTEKCNKHFVLFIEMKKGQGGSEKDIIKQLKGTQCLLSYCREIGKLFFNQPTFLSVQKYAYRFISIRYIGVNKKPTYNKPDNQIHNNPENMLKISAPKNLQFKQLL